MNPSVAIPGIHHVTAIAGDPQRNLDFYSGLLGLRLVKRTVNFDDPETYHLYYGDDVGRPGTVLTFFPFAGAPRGRRGTGQVAAISFAVPAGALPYWRDRLQSHVPVTGPERHFGEDTLLFLDPDGLQLELVSAPDDGRGGWTGGPVPPRQAIRGFHGVTLWVRDEEPTARVLTDILGFRETGREGRRTRYAIAESGSGAGSEGGWVDLLALPDGKPGVVASGTVHHVAWRTPDDEQQRTWQRALAARGLGVTEVRDRQYFHSIYFHEPGGVLFEIATDTPGFTTDETPEALGTGLKLPPWLEPRRARLERSLQPLQSPHAVWEG